MVAFLALCFNATILGYPNCDNNLELPSSFPYSEVIKPLTLNPKPRNFGDTSHVRRKDRESELKHRVRSVLSCEAAKGSGATYTLQCSWGFIWIMERKMEITI